MRRPSSGRLGAVVGIAACVGGALIAAPAGAVGGQNPHMVQVTLASGYGTYGPTACDLLNAGGATFSFSTGFQPHTPSFGFSLTMPGTTGCAKLHGTSVQGTVQAQHRGTTFTLTGTVDVYASGTGTTTTGPATLTFQAVGPASRHLTLTKVPGEPIRLFNSRTSSCTVTLTVATETYTTAAPTGTTYYCTLVSGVGSGPTTTA